MADRTEAETSPAEQQPIMCGGCGATADKERCIGCLHDFGTPESEWVRKLAKEMLDGKRA